MYLYFHALKNIKIAWIMYTRFQRERFWKDKIIFKRGSFNNLKSSNSSLNRKSSLQNLYTKVANFLTLRICVIFRKKDSEWDLYKSRTIPSGSEVKMKESLFMNIEWYNINDKKGFVLFDVDVKFLEWFNSYNGWGLYFSTSSENKYPCSVLLIFRNFKLVGFRFDYNDTNVTSKRGKQ